MRFYYPNFTHEETEAPRDLIDLLHFSGFKPRQSHSLDTTHTKKKSEQDHKDEFDIDLFLKDFQ